MVWIQCSWAARNHEAFVVRCRYGLRLLLEIVDERIEIDQVQILPAFGGGAKAQATAAGVLEVVQDDGVFACVVQWTPTNTHGKKPRPGRACRVVLDHRPAQMHDRTTPPDEVLEISTQVTSGHRDAIENVPERLDLEEIAVRRDAGTHGSTDATVVHDADVALAFDAHRVGNEIA